MVRSICAIQKTQELLKIMYYPGMTTHDATLAIQLDRRGGASLAMQISGAIGAAIRSGNLAPGARLPSWHDLAAQLGVARGTVRLAYENLRDQQLVYTAGAAGTRVALDTPRQGATPAGACPATPGPASPRRTGPAPFQVCMPAQDAFPFKTWSRIMGRTARAAAALPMGYPDPCGEPALRSEIAAYLCVARGIECAPAQVFITNGFSGALDLVLRALRLEGRRAWMEDPGYSTTRALLLQAGLAPVPVPVDADGLIVSAGLARAPDAALAVVTPGQQAPLGMTLSSGRRQALLDWAAACGAWIVEDDYLGELQLQGRATPALAARDRGGRVLHIGTFSKTLHPGLRVGFLVVPAALAEDMAQVADRLASAPTPAIQLAIAEFMRDGHYLRHLRRMKRLYAERRLALLACLREMGLPHAAAGLSVLLTLPEGRDDLTAAGLARAAGLAPSALSWWCAEPLKGPGGLLLGVTNVAPERIRIACRELATALGLSDTRYGLEK